jgi:lipoate-protein ligase A
MRFIDLGTITPEYSVCADKVLLNSYHEDTLVIYSRDCACVSVGRSQRIDGTVNSEYVKKNNISVVRRISGGSNIYSDPSQITYSLIVSRDRLPASRNDSFAAVCNAVVLSLKRLGIDGVHKPVNDVLVNGKKISGGAQARTRNAILQHGSIILDADHDAMASSLIRTKERSYDGMTSVRECLGFVPKRNEIADALKSGFGEVFGPVVNGKLTEKEKTDIQRLTDLLLV